MKVAFVGCGHGNLDLIYNNLAGSDVDALIVCGDFEACRNELDLECLAGPAKYHFLKDYWKYYKGTAQAPILTLFVGGNHEASNHLWELYYGGWVAPNIYYLGHSGVVKIGDLRVAGISGIYDKRDYYLGHHERFPYNPSSVRSIYHTRECEIWKMKHLTGEIDAFLSHDWPQEIVKHGDLQELYKKNGHLKGQIDSGEFGSPASWELLQRLKPKWWVSGHMHIRYQAAYTHPDKNQTKFLALSKSIPAVSVRDYLAIVDFPDKSTGPLTYDQEWLAILRATHSRSFFAQKARIPNQIELEAVQLEMPKVQERYAKRTEGYKIVSVPFPQDAPVSPLSAAAKAYEQPTEFTQNSQSVQFILDLGLFFPGLTEEDTPAPQKETPEPKKEEVTTLTCGVCKLEWSIPKKAMLSLQEKGIGAPGECKQCQRRKNVQTGWRK